MDDFLGWPPIMWTLRISILIVLAGGSWILLLLFSRFFRWKTVRAMLLADPPHVESLGGEFAGAKAELKLQQPGRAEQISTLEERVTRLESIARRTVDALDASSETRERSDE